MSIAEIRYNAQDNPVSKTPLDERITDSQKKGVIHVGDVGKDLLARIEAFPHLVEYDRLSTMQTTTFPANARYVIAENTEAVTVINCRLDWTSDGLVASEIKQAIIAGERINNNPELRIGNASYEWTKTP